MRLPNTIAETRPPRAIRFFNHCDRFLSKIGLKWGKWSARELIELTRRQTGLEDFGGGDFFEPLSRLLESCHREANLNAVGKLALRADVTRTLCNRLYMRRDRDRSPEI